MTLRDKYRAVFKRMETDAEFITRLGKCAPWALSYLRANTDLRDVLLDLFAEHNFNVQRRIVEDAV